MATALVVVLCLAASVESHGADLEFVVDRSDGAVFIRSTALTSQVFDGYSVSSAGGSLDVGSWTRVTDSYDLSGDQSVDSTANWFILGASVSNVAEASPDEGSASLAAGQVVSLGNLFNTGLAEDWSVTTSSNGVTSDPFAAAFRNLKADYDADLDVDQDDYGVFAATFGSTIDLRADGNGDGIVNAIDYTIWRDSPSLSLAPAQLPALIRAGGIAIPEPAAALLVGLAILGVSSRACCRG